MEEVKIQSVAGADFVFEEEYALPSLLEVDQYIREHHHLPEVPSASSMQQEGINLGEMNILLLQKIEELTLYLLDQNKQLKEIKRENSKLQQRISQLEKLN